MDMISKIKDIDLEVKILICSFLITTILGVLPSIILKDWEWFSKSGSLLVVFGIYVVWRDYKGEIDGVLLDIRKAMKEKHKKNIDIINIKEKGIINSVMKKGKSENSLNEGVNLVKGIRKSNQKTYDKLEFIIISAGTIIWGYGNLLNAIYR